MAIELKPGVVYVDGMGQRVSVFQRHSLDTPLPFQSCTGPVSYSADGKVFPGTDDPDHPLHRLNIVAVATPTV